MQLFVSRNVRHPSDSPWDQKNTVKLGTLRIRALWLPHRDPYPHYLGWVNNVCYFIFEKKKSGKFSRPLLYLTDAAWIPNEYIWGVMPRCKWIIIEANHDIGLLMNSDFNGTEVRYAELNKRRITLSHLSNFDTALALTRACFESKAWFKENRIKHVIISHVSQDRNDEEKLRVIEEKLEESGFEIDVRYASANTPTPRKGWFQL